jgi:hypothetical protein
MQDLYVSLKKYVSDIDKQKKLIVEYNNGIRRVKNPTEIELMDYEEKLTIAKSKITFLDENIQSYFKETLELVEAHIVFAYLDEYKPTYNQLTAILNDKSIPDIYKTNIKQIIDKISSHSKYFKKLKAVETKTLPNDVTCMICMERNQTYLVKQKCCNYYCCEECLYQYIKTSITNNKEPLCPGCRTPYVIR